MKADIPHPPDPQESLGVLLGLVRSELVRAMEAELASKGLDLRFTQFLILKRLGMLGPMTASELARAVELDGGAMTRQLDHLEGKGYLRRCPHAQDRRALRIELTAAGEALWRELTGCNERVLAAAQRSLGETERRRLHDYLERVLHALRDKH
ncbi:MarR family winged helix-turn-helix transcriptional regulator [Fulvimonas soli]|jgi:DNA-binding MarR family transcriptional regulator|uniref:MarR family transcriptional regulator n=1 Tax=Fulvimonas soli TaxID=155197 RepID=A0A316IHD5_9GAMM|nr:MarR family transcriptional regulator [Fulvimonas soli]PWK92473.1 MarR family transcriptional regulator [Fulvimonas soli]TNY27145.1 MarR family transcriptional regulator [Fulvimonas soli]